MKTFKQYFEEAVLMEVPIPDEWDKDVYTDKTSFAKQVRYAMERAAKLGAGSSRVVFNIEYEGRPTALKIAKNKKGLAQNEREADYGLYRMYPDITTPLIDFDETNESPRWIHTEMAEKMTKAKFKNLTGFPFDAFASLLKQNELDREGNRYRLNYRQGIEEELQDQIEESELFYDVTDLMGNFLILAGDLTRTANWGIYKGRPVIIDLGFNSDVHKQYYS